MRAWILIVLVGCSFPTPPDVSGTIDAATGDAPDAPDAAVDPDADPDVPATTDSVDVQFTITGPPSTTIAWTITSGGGAFLPASGSVATTAAGVGVLQTVYTAPGTAGDRAHVLALAGAGPHSFSTLVRTLVPVGESTAFASSNGQAVISNVMYAQRVQLPAPAIVMKLGFLVDITGGSARLALYSEAGNAPGTLLANTAAAPIALVSELAVTTPVLLPAGAYWIAADFEAAAHVRSDTTRTAPQAFQNLAFTTAFPTQAGTSAITDSVLNYYVLTAN
jgi:hypothetical protein